MLSRLVLWLERGIAGWKTKKKRVGPVATIGPDDESTEEAMMEAIYADWDAVLARCLKPGAEGQGVTYAAMDYEALARDEGFGRVVDGLAKLDADAVAAAGANVRAALYVNAYNVLCCAHVVRSVRGGTLPASIRDLSTKKSEIWDLAAGVVAGEEVSLNKVEHQVLRSGFDEPRIHACVNCASRSCPDLRGEAYRGKRLDSQMSDQTRRWLADETKGLSTKAGAPRPTISRIFLWFEGDFKPGGVAAFVAAWAPDDKAAAVAKDPRFDYYPYDWSLNGTRRG
mmetsp:Transcript_3162/g.8170  ORF Transcript_3162/g.8170 Transcript_3162/m.8170 type:complete len:283 (-) Transcript_3162:208-1056(-)